MRHLTILLLSLAFATLLPAIVSADDDHGRAIVTVAFGAGLNTAQPGNSANHHVIPETIRISAGDVISFNVAQSESHDFQRRSMKTLTAASSALKIGVNGFSAGHFFGSISVEMQRVNTVTPVTSCKVTNFFEAMNAARALSENADAASRSPCAFIALTNRSRPTPAYLRSGSAHHAVSQPIL